MTLNIRNALLKSLFAISIIFILTLIVLGIVSVITNKFFFPFNVTRPIPLSNTLFIFRADIIPTFIAIGVLLLYVPVTSLRLYFTFEKTKSTEIYYFIAFLSACLIEGCRFFFPFGNIWYNYSSFFSFITRLIFCARLIAPFSFFLAAFLIATNQPQNADRAYIILFVIGIGFAAVIPVDTFHVLSNSMIAYGYGRTFVAIGICVSLLTFISLNFIAAQRQPALEYMHIPFGYILLIAGYMFLLFADCYVLTVVGTIMLLSGTQIYIRNLHKYYMWQ